MTTPLQERVEVGADHPAMPGGAAARRKRPTRDQLMIAALALLALGLTVVGVLGRAGSGVDLDPDSTAPDGARAVTEVLRTQGVPVQVRRSVAELDPNASGTVVIVHPEIVPVGTLRALADSDADLVLIEPDPSTLDLLRVNSLTAGSVEPTQIRAPGCAEPLAQVGPVTAGGRQYLPLQTQGSESISSTSICFGENTSRGSWALAQESRRRIVLIGQPEILRNRSLALQGNSALALRSMGHREQVQWYVPNPADLAGEEGPTLVELLPKQLPFLLVATLLPILAVMYWRGRRFGPLVSEPLPVVVRASETAEGRGRLYRRAKARDRVAATLRTATARRLAARLNISSGTPEELVNRLADLTGRPRHEIDELLVGPTPHDDAGLLQLATSLEDLERALSSASPGAGADPTPTPTQDE